MVQTGYHAILNEPNPFWVAATNAGNMPDVTRVAGLAHVEEISTITFYLSEAFGSNLLETFKKDAPVTLLVTSIDTFESYQYKGVYESKRPCTPDEEEQQHRHFEGFTNKLKTIGIPPGEADKICGLYFQQPSWAVTFRVRQIFIQTPQKGAGSCILNLEEADT
jgi:hypothetical protein